MKSKVIVPALSLCLLAACGGDPGGETAGPPAPGGSNAGAAGLEEQPWDDAGAAGQGGATYDAGAAGQGGMAGASGGGSGGFAGMAGASAGGSGGAAGMAGASTGGFGGKGGSGGTGGKGGSGGGGFGGVGGIKGTGGTSGSGGGGFGGVGGIKGTGGTSGSGGTGGGVSIIPFVTNITKSDLAVVCAGGNGLMTGTYTVKYTNILYSAATSAAVTQSHVLLTKGGKTMSYTFTVNPTLSPQLSMGSSATVDHAHKYGSGSGTDALCKYCGGTMVLEVQWMLSSGKTQTDTLGPIPVQCDTVT